MLADTQRRDLLTAMGIDVYVLRAAEASRAAATTPSDWLIVAASDAALKSPQCIQFRKTLPAVVGLPSERIRWISADGDKGFDDVPRANAYLVLGAALARSLGAQLSATQQNSAVIAVADEPAQSFGSGMARRALWQTLKPIARRAREAL
jgi:hypothetical protein